ncbi:MAG: cell division protein ZapE [Pelagibacteraceae bacterium]|jgi:cell division protein ZapE
MKSFKDTFDSFCKKNNIKKNEEQLNLVEKFDEFNAIINQDKTLLKKIFSKAPTQLGYYIHGDVGVGKTMICNEFYNYIDTKKKKTHFNKFMIEVHDFLQQNQKNDKAENLLTQYARSLKEKINFLYFDEFQVTNIVDAMILGKLFESLFEEKIFILITSNLKINDLYKDGLQRDQFLPFLKIIKEKIYEYELKGDVDFRKQDVTKINRFFHPNDKRALSNINQLFRKLTKDRKKLQKEIIIRGRKFPLEQFYDGVARFDFKELCDQNLGAEDYIEIAKFCKFIIIENIPNFNEGIANQQQRFITLIDVFYENRIKLMVSSKSSLEDISSASGLEFVFKRTKSRLYELTSPMVT